MSANLTKPSKPTTTTSAAPSAMVPPAMAMTDRVPSSATAEHAFLCCSDAPLFAVRGDVPTDDALEMASNFLSSARHLAYSFAVEHDDESAFGLAYLIEMAKGIVDASILGLPSQGGAEGGAA